MDPRYSLRVDQAVGKGWRSAGPELAVEGSALWEAGSGSSHTCEQLQPWLGPVTKPCPFLGSAFSCVALILFWGFTIWLLAGPLQLLAPVLSLANESFSF